MGRQPYLTLLALGRSAYEPPEDGPRLVASRTNNRRSSSAPSALDASAAVSPVGRHEDPPEGVQLYDARGHPYNPWARVRSRRDRAAMNDVLSVVGLVQRNLPEALEELGGASHDQIKVASDEENAMGEKIGWAADIDNQFLSWWIHAFTNRLLVFAPSIDSSFVNITKIHYDTLGFRDFFFAGLPAFIFSSLVNPEIWTYQVATRIDRFVWATFISRKQRIMYGRIRPYLLGPIEVLLNVFILPFRLHSMLQLLGLVPGSQLLPPVSSWLPFCGTSLIRFRWENLPLLHFFAYRPISSAVHHYIYLSCRSAIMEPMNPSQRRDSSASRFATSINSVHLVVLPNIATPFTGFFQRIFAKFGWCHPLHRSATPSLSPALQRRETWTILETAEAANNAQRPVTPINPRRHSLGTQPAPDEHITQSSNAEGQRQGHSPSSLRGNGDDEDEDHGTVNLEIGITEPLSDEQNATRITDQEARRLQTRLRNGEATSSDREWLRMYEEGRRNQAALDHYSKSHRVSKLALEPTDMLASLINGWVAGWFLMPLRAYVLGKLVKHVLARPTLFGVVASAPGLALINGPRHISSYASKLVLCAAVDVCLGMGFWITEWMVVRRVGVGYFNWGSM
ncbi:hypothetical protein EJ08DRAFT_650067 [Tothia fuscella]|uniref:Uncharacterized protein n=1 Tax=Tothia fuscella TaxID=1048955 RepID=A0A9P4NQX2_9PEZI|nr:hypothetical protein EJ08DRAFT_650067 [Tothia fuscella]